MDYSLIIPIYNEEKTLPELLAQLEKFSNIFEIIIINDGSNDETKNILENNNSFKIFHLPKNIGKGYALIMGVNYAKSENIILMDGDLEIKLSCIQELIKKFKTSKKHVVSGNRWIINYQDKTDLNTYGNHFFNQIFNLLYDTQLEDILCCAKILNKKLFKTLNLKSKRFSIEAELMSKLAFKGIKILEVGVPYKRRTNSQGKKLKISDGWSIIFTMLKIRIKGILK